MEILAIVVLCVSALASFSTAENKPKPNDDQRSNQDADLPFTEACEIESSSDK